MSVVRKESYPSPPPMWFAESEDAKITQIVEALGGIEPCAPKLVRWYCFLCIEVSLHFVEFHFTRKVLLSFVRVIVLQLLRSTKHLAKELYKWQNLPVPPNIESLDNVELIQVSSSK